MVCPAPRPAHRSTSSGSTGASLASSHILLPLDENERLLSLQMAIKCADLGHCTAARPVHKRWAGPGAPPGLLFAIFAQGV